MALSVKTKRAVLLVASVLKKTTRIKLERKAKQKQNKEAVRVQHAKTLEAAESRVIEVLQPFFTRQIKTAVLRMQEKGEKFFEELVDKASSCGAGAPGAPGFAPQNTCHGGGGSAKPAGGSGNSVLDSPQFKSWFGESKVVDSNGNPKEEYGPKPIFHGTSQSFETFDSDRIGDHGIVAGKGFYFAENKEVANSFKSGKDGVVIEAFLSIKKPYDLDSQVSLDWAKSLSRHAEGNKPSWFYKEDEYHKTLEQLAGANKGLTGYMAWTALKRHVGESKANWFLQKDGFDGVTHRASDSKGTVRYKDEEKDFGRVWVAFAPTQIKSVNNEGTFDPTNPNINKAFTDSKVFCPTGPGGGIDATCKPGGGGSWKPMMSDGDAAEWAKDSKIQGVYFSRMDKAKADSIKKEGFDFSKTGGGGTTWQGAGLYLLNGHPPESFGAEELAFRVNVKNPFVGTDYEVDAKTTEMKKNLQAPEVELVPGVVVRMWKTKAQENQALTKMWQDEGYDSIKMIVNNSSEVLTIFDPKSVVVISAEKEKSTFTETKDFVGRYLEQHRSAETKPLKASRYFNPRDWDEELIDRVLPTLAQIFGEEMIAELKRNGVDVKKLRNKCQQIYFEKSAAEKVFCATGPGGGIDATCKPGGGRNRTQLQNDAINAYTGSGKNTFGLEEKDRNSLNSMQDGIPINKLTPKAKKVALALLSAVEVHQEPKTVYRGIFEFNSRSSKFLEQLENSVGGEIKLTGFHSTSTDPTIAASDFSNGTVLKIKQHKGIVVETSNFTQSEIIAPPTSYRVVSKSIETFRESYTEKKIKRQVYHLEELPSYEAKAKSTETKASTATEWLQQTGDSIANDWSFETPSGLVSMDFMTEYPDWMKEAIRDNLNETFSQDYWTKVNDTTLGDIDGFLQQGARDGWSINDIAKEISTQLAEEGKYGLRRGKLIARTELGNALNGARSSSMDALIDEVGDQLPMKKQWLSVLGTTTRDTHAHLDGVPADKNNQWTLGGVKCRWPSDVVLPAKERCNCFPGETQVSGAFSGAQRVWYDGIITKIKTASGACLTVTPNHPIMTEKGWRFAGSLNPHDKVACYPLKVDVLPVPSTGVLNIRSIGVDLRSGNQVYDKPTTIQQVFETFSSVSAGVEVRRAAMDDFYGDGESMDGNIEIVRPDWSLLDNFVPNRLKKVGSFVFAPENAELLHETSFCSGSHPFRRVSTTSSGDIHGVDPSFDGFVPVGSIAPSGELAVGVAAEFDPRSSKTSPQDATTNPELLRQSLQRNPGLVFFDDIVEIINDHFSGHVYDLQSKTGFIIAADPGMNTGIIATNCQCTIILAFGMQDEDAQDLINSYTERIALKKSIKEYLATQKVFCPTGPGGGIDATCGKGKLGHGGAVYTAPKTLSNGEILVGSVGAFSGVDVSDFKQGLKDAIYTNKKIAELEKLANDGDWNTFQHKMINPKVIGKYQKVIIKAQQNLLALKNKQSTELPKEATLSPTNPVISTDAGWKKIGPQLGTEKGGKYKLGDKEYYVKQPDDPARAHNEVLATKLYELAGGNVVKTQLLEIEGKTSYASEWEDTTKADWNSPSTKAMAAEDFAIHAWLNNRDAVGAGSENPMDNIRVSKSGVPILVDAGGALDYSGMGGSGKKPLTLNADEWHTLRDPSKNPTMAKVFGTMTAQQLIDSAKKLEAVKQEDIADLVNKFSDKTTAEKNKLIFTLKARRDDILEAAVSLGKKFDEVKKQPAAVVTDAEVKKAIEGTIPPALPAPFKIIGKSLAYMQPKVDAIAAAAAKGDIKGVENVKIKEGAANPNYQKIEQYKKSVLAAMKGGSTVPASSGTISAPKPAAPAPVKINPNKFPDEPSFITKNPEMVAANKDLVSKIKQLAVSGDLNSLSATVTTGFIGGVQIMSPKVKSYAQQLHAEVASQLAPPPAAPKKLSESFQELSAKVGNPKTAGALKKIGYWNVLAEIGGVPETIPAGTFNAYQPDLQKKGHAAAKKSGAFTAIKNYTGGSYHGMNDALRNDKHGSSDGIDALKAAEGIMKHGIEIPAGTVLSRRHQLDAGEIDLLKAGQVVSDKALLSTSTNPTAWSGKVQWKMTVGEGVKGMPVDGFSKNSGSEQEVVLPPNQRILVTSVKKLNEWATEVHAVILPTLSNQCCPP